ncbi:MAG TPA: LapA family protein [Beijerinckiaceae bacterium]|nr:LapA family protein [Beijerinckiaceae bacterium]
MLAFLRLLLLAPIAVVLIMLALANRTPVPLSFDIVGLEAQSVTVPLYVALLGAVMLGILIGGIACWIGQGKHRKAAREAGRAADQARAEAERLKLAASPLAALPPR